MPYVLLQDGGKIRLQDGTGFELLQDRIHEAAIVLTESLVKSVLRSIQETVTLTENFLPEADQSKTFQETVQLSENLVKSVTRAILETVTLTENQSVAFQRFLESVGITEVLTTVKTARQSAPGAIGPGGTATSTAAAARSRQRLRLPFYPRLVWGSPVVTINLSNPKDIIIVGDVVAKHTVSKGNKQGNLHIRFEHRVTLKFERMPVALVEALETYWHEWGSQKQVATLTLDTRGGGSGWWEYDNYNTFFNLAIWDGGDFEPRMGRLRRQVYDVELAFRQGAL